MTIEKTTGRQCPEFIVKTVTAAQLAAEGTLTSGVTVTIADMPVGAIPLAPTIAETFDGNTNDILIGLGSDDDAIRLANASLGVEVGAVQTSGKAVTLKVTGTITTGAIQLAIPYLTNNRSDSVYGDE